MSIKITFHGHAAFSLSDGTHTVLIDPFITGNPQAEAAGITADSISCTHIALTHGHEDHVGDTIAIAKRCDATVLGPFELCNMLGEEGLEKLEPANPGGGVDMPFGRITMTNAFHSSSFGGKYMGMPTGLVIRMGDTTIYNTGDTGIFGDMALIAEIHRPDVLILPIGDRFTMGPADATRAAEMVNAPIAIPCHFGTWPLIDIDPTRFTEWRRGPPARRRCLDRGLRCPGGRTPVLDRREKRPRRMAKNSRGPRQADMVQRRISFRS